MYALIDCNQFYVSCERIFRPALHNRPVVVLSNNDGCVVTLSLQAKKLGIKRGSPYFQIKSLLHKHNGIACSSNYALYGDISQRVLDTLYEFSPDVEPYSIDEAFIDFSSMKSFFQHKDISYVNYATSIRKRLWKDIRMGVGVGIGPTRTLAKLANRIAKRRCGVYAFDIPNDALPFLQKTDLSDIWGIGHRSVKRLQRSHPVYTALDFLHLCESIVQKKLGINGLRTHRELRGIPCIDTAMPLYPKSMRHGRSFSHQISDTTTLSGVVARFCGELGRKLRKRGVFAHTLQLRLIPPYGHSNRTLSACTSFCDTQDTRVLVRHALLLLNRLHPHHSTQKWKKAEVHLIDLHNHQNLPLFHAPEDPTIMNLLDDLQKKFGTHTIRTGFESPHSPVGTQYCSPHFSTRWSDLLTIKI
ncbi:MAG: hypothetical protein CL916_09145 [Deltaproteobacteria bacterium]|nr:hypothetical protein [Deltaproteobacteria bacterium]